MCELMPGSVVLPRPKRSRTKSPTQWGFLFATHYACVCVCGSLMIKGQQIDDGRWEMARNCGDTPAGCSPGCQASGVCVFVCGGERVRGWRLLIASPTHSLTTSILHPQSLGAACLSSVLAAVLIPLPSTLLTPPGSYPSPPLRCRLSEARSAGVSATPCHSAPRLRSRRGRSAQPLDEAAAAVRCCKWLSWLTDGIEIPLSLASTVRSCASRVNDLEMCWLCERRWMALAWKL